MTIAKRPNRRLFAFDALEGRALMAVVVHAQISMPMPSPASNMAFVNNLFTSILGRSPSDAELTDITNRLGSPKFTRNALALGILDSVEHRTQIVNAAYAAYSAVPTQAQLNTGLTYLASNGGNTNTLYAQVYGTLAYSNSMGATTNVQLVNAFASTAGITLSQNQTNNYVRQLDRGHQTPYKVANLILTSHDAVGVQINEVYNQYLGISPTTAQLNQAFKIVGSNKRWGLDLALINSAAFSPT